MSDDKNDFKPAKQHAVLTTGEVIKMLRGLKGWTQEALATYSAINAKNISMLENNKIEIGKKRAEQLARAFNVAPCDHYVSGIRIKGNSKGGMIRFSRLIGVWIKPSGSC